jgi:hypothetical protein
MANPERYLPPFVSQRATKLSSNGIDDCRVIATQALVAAASLGESVTNDRGVEMTDAQLVNQAAAMRKGLDDLKTKAVVESKTGSLNSGHARRMVDAMWPQYPTLVLDDISFSELVSALLDGSCASLSGNPAHIKDHGSPLRRAGDVGHEFFLARAKQTANGTQILVYDPFRDARKNQRGEWRPAHEIRQFAFKDEDKGLTAVFVERYGAWARERRRELRLQRRLDRMDDLVKELRAEIRTLKRASPGDFQAASDQSRARALVEAREAAVQAIDALG